MKPKTQHVHGSKIDKTSHPIWKYRLAENFVFRMPTRMSTPVIFVSHSGYTIGEWRGFVLTIFSGYMLDGASGWPDHEIAMPGFVLHDFGYQLAQILTRKEWDRAMFDVQEAVSYRWRHIVYAGVRLGGWKAYGQRDYVEIISV